MMNGKESNKLLLELIKGTPEIAGNWFQSVKTQVIIPPENFNWTLFVSETTTNAHCAAKQDKKKLSLAWAEISIKLYPFVSEQFTEATIRFSNECSEMYLRAGLINQFGNFVGHPILDNQIIVKWFLDNLEMSLSEATNHSFKWEGMSHEERVNSVKDTLIPHQISNIKNRLNPIYFLYENGNIIPTEELKKWIDLRGKLI